MSWYNNVKKLEENVESFFKNYDEIDFNLLEFCIKGYKTAEKNKDRSGFLSSKPESTTKQRIRHELNCEDWEYKRMLVQRCIDELSTFNEGGEIVL